MTPILIDDAMICTDAAARTGSVLVESGRIEAVAFMPEERTALRARAGEVVNGTGHWLMPGMVDAHAHAYGTLLRGTENSLPLELWALHTTLYGRAFDAPALRAATLLGAAERIRAGITSMVDHAVMMPLAEASLAAHESSGLRVAYAPFLHDVSDYDLLDLSLPDVLRPLVGGPPPLDAVTYTGRFAAIVQAARAGSGRVSIQLGPNAPQRCSPAAWVLWRTLRDRHGVAVHTHLLETRAQASLNARWPGGLVAEMERQGLLDGSLTCAHGVWLSEAEMETLARHDVTVSHNPASNLMLGSGVMRFRACAACGLRLALGNDSANTAGRADHFAGMRLAMSLPRQDGGDFALWPKASEIFSAATEAGAAALDLKGQLGRVAPGQIADLVLVRAKDAGTLAARPTLDVMVQHAGVEHVDNVMVDGQWVMRDGRILAFDEAAMLVDAQEQSVALQQRVAMNLPVLLAAMPGMATRFRQSCT
ncbi:amidohydrolase family protein [Rhodopila sp.]|uniref:amidohydrolase family protein n=1 Tax=Rhodopila sp. TaxID=2480087 RepID=UPI003D141DB3